MCCIYSAMFIKSDNWGQWILFKFYTTAKYKPYLKKEIKPLFNIDPY